MHGSREVLELLVIIVCMSWGHRIVAFVKMAFPFIILGSGKLVTILAIQDYPGTK